MRVLIADDEELVVEFLERSLKLDKYVIDTARDGLELLQKSSSGSYDVIIADIIMPLCSGLEVCKELRRNNNFTPIILLTSRDTEAARVKGLNCGADDYITKPFRYRELEARIRAVTRRPHTIQPDNLTAGPLTYHSASKTITLNGQVLDLRPKEFALLEYFIRNANKVISKEELLQNVWRISANNASNRLEVCMYHIRNKVNAEKLVLKTVRGYGYVLKV